MPKIVVYQTAPVWFVKNEYFMAKIDVCRSLLHSDRVIGWDIVFFIVNKMHVIMKS